MKTLINICIGGAACILIATLSANAAIVFSEGFESPVVSGYSQASSPSANWVMSDSGGNPYGWERKGLHNTDDTTFSTPYGDQAFSVRFYQGAYLTTSVGALGSVSNGEDYTVTFNIAGLTSNSAAANYNLELWALSGVTDTNRRHNSFDGAGTAVLLGSATGSVSSTDMSASDSISYSATATYAGYDLAIRIAPGGNNSSNHITYDNIQLDVVPEPSAFALIGLGLLGLYFLRRRPA
jgi:hypothetical protein